MASLESLPADQRAVLQLVLQRNRSYDEIARLLSMDRTAVRHRAVGAIVSLGPDTGLPQDRRELISDYLLGQLEPEAAEAVRDGIGGSPADRAWARVVASELAPLAAAPLPEIPNGPAAFPPPPAASLEPVATAEPMATADPVAAPPAPEALPPPAPAAPVSPPPAAAPAPTIGAREPEASPPPAPAGGKRQREPLFLGRKRGGDAEADPVPKEKKPREPLFLGRKRGGDAEADSVPKEKKPREPLFLGRKRGGDAPPPDAPTVSSAAAGGDGNDTRSSRLGGMILIALTVIIVAAVVVIFLNKSSGSSSPTATSTPAASASSTGSNSTSSTAPATPGGSPSATTTASSSSSAKVVAQINLTPPTAGSKAAGIAEVLKEGSTDGIAIVAQNVTPNTTKPPNAYAVWLYNSPTDSHILGFVNPGVGASGKLSTAGGLPANASHYKQLIVTLETKASPKTPGTTILQGTLTGL